MHTARQLVFSNSRERLPDPAVPQTMDDRIRAIVSNAPRGVVEFFQLTFDYRTGRQNSREQLSEKRSEERELQEMQPPTPEVAHAEHAAD